MFGFIPDWLVYQVIMLLLIVASFYLYLQWQQHQRKKQREAETALMVTKIRAKKSTRRAFVTSILREHHQLSDTALVSKVDEIIQLEQRIHNALIYQFSSQKGEALIKLSLCIDQVIDALLRDLAQPVTTTPQSASENQQQSVVKSAIKDLDAILAEIPSFSTANN
jgi:hypothetical protein